MNIVIRSAAAVCVAALMGCQQTAPHRIPAASDPGPASMRQSTPDAGAGSAAGQSSTRTAAAAAAQANARTAPGAPTQTTARTAPAAAVAANARTAPAATATAQKQASAIITVHLAQERPEAPLVAVDVGGASLYALPQPVLTQTDIARVSPVTGQGQRTYLMLELNPAGAAKLQNVTRQARGHYLLLSVQGQLVNVAKINEAIDDGRLVVGTQNAQHTRAILQLMQGK